MQEGGGEVHRAAAHGVRGSHEEKGHGEDHEHHGEHRQARMYVCGSH